MEKTERPTLKDIAQRSGFSLRTVKKVMNGDLSVKEKTRKAVLNAAEDLHYVRNRMASALARHQKIRLAVVYGKSSDAYFPKVKKGLERSEKEFLDYGLILEYHVHNEADIRTQERSLRELATREDIRGVLLQPLGATRLTDAINALVESGKPVVTFGSDAPGSRRLCYIGPDAYRAGRIGCQILANYIGKQGRVFILKLNADHMQTRDRTRGFLDRMTERYPQMQATEMEIELSGQSRTQMKELYRHQVETVISQKDARAIFCTSANTYLIGQILKSCGRPDIVVVGFDLPEETVALMREGYIDVIIEQKPEQFAYAAAQILLRYIMDGEKPQEFIYTSLYIVTSECLNR